MFATTYPSLHAHFQPFVDALKKRQDKGRFWWDLRSCGYYEKFTGPKIPYQDITWRSQFTLDTLGRMCNDTVYFLPVDSGWILAVLNLPMLWAFLWRRAAHGKDEALRLFSDFVATIPIALPSNADRTSMQHAIERLAPIARADQVARQDLATRGVRRSVAGAAT